MSNKAQIWQPGMGIRFSPKTSAVRLYPDLSVVRPVQLLARPMSTSETNAQPGANVGDELPENILKRPAQTEIEGADERVAKSPTPNPPPTPAHAPTSHFLASGAAPKTSLEWNVSQSKFDAALACKTGTPGSFWSHTLYERTGAAGETEHIKVHYCTSKSTMENICERYFADEPVLGFDLEWMSYANRNSGPRMNVSLIQIASPSRIGLFHVALFPKDDFVSPTLKKIMEDVNVTKAGVNILGDATRMKNILGINMAGVFELSHLYKLVLYSKTGQTGRIGRAAVTMGTQVKDCLGLPVFKGESVRTSNWMLPLNTRQLQYAASDAYAGLQLYHVLEEHRLRLRPCPPRPHHAELKLPIRRATETAEALEIAEEDLIDETLADEDLLALENGSLDETALSEIPAKQQSPSSTKAKDEVSNAPTDVDSRVTGADEKTQIHRSAQGSSARPSALRAYYIWHDNEDLSPAAVAALLRDPPLATNTVVSYILQAITAEKLPYSSSRLSKEVLSLMHESAIKGRYQELAQACGHEVKGPNEDNDNQ